MVYNKLLNKMRGNNKKVGSSKYRNFKQIVNTFYNEEVDNIENNDASLQEKLNIKIEPIILYDKLIGTMRVEFKLGKDRMYKIKNISDFYTRMEKKEKFKYGEKLDFIHTAEVFSDDSQDILKFLLKYAEIIKYANSNTSNLAYYGKTMNESSILLSNSGLDEIFEILKNTKVQFGNENIDNKVKFVNENPQIKFTLKKLEQDEYEIYPNVDIFKLSIINGKKYKYIFKDKSLYRCDEDYSKSTYKMIEIFRKNYITEAKLGKEELKQFFSIIMPKINDAVSFKNIGEDEIEKYKPKDLRVKAFLDFDSNNYIICDVRFIYEENEFNPLDENTKINFPRNIVQETDCLNIFRQSGFMVDIKNLKFILPNDDGIYKFLTEDINYYMQKFDVLVTDNFKQKEIKQTKIGNLGVKLENDLLNVDLSNLNIDLNEIEQIMERYKLKRKFYRMKDGSFLELEDNNEIDFLDKLINGMDIELKDLSKGNIQLPKNRTLYLNQLLKGIKGTEIFKNTEYREVVNGLNKETIEDEIKIPDNLENILRYYQKTGFRWLKVLDNYGFGGVLADDMGLGKTIQMLSIIIDYIKNDKNETKKRATLVVSPSSLALNWKKEAEKFTSDLKTLVIKGTANDRAKLIEQIDNYDIVITSYDLLKRDIEIYKEKDYQFRFIIADEAQYLKNSNTQNAKSVKEIKADTRYALTGTPIENSLAELWSIFDFIMPGYLYTYKKFRNTYEVPIVKDDDIRAMERLKMLIEPFVLRRTKKEVLKELPEKTVTILNNEMGEEQRKIYMSYLAQAKEELNTEIKTRGYEKSRMKILAILTRLRQICCHPSLFINNYKDGSSKLEQCMELIEDATKGGHKLLVFSGYTSMFEIIEKNLKDLKINYLKLTGSTKVDERIKMVDEFNENQDIKVFLISLKAGGTGLNLTGADMVIHYDPWWNLSTENQATDRAYRIGQKNNVQVYKLITNNSIEEKIYELQKKKSTLIDNVLDTRMSFINKLSKEEIMNLFE